MEWWGLQESNAEYSNDSPFQIPIDLNAPEDEDGDDHMENIENHVGQFLGVIGSLAHRFAQYVRAVRRATEADNERDDTSPHGADDHVGDEGDAYR